MQPKSTHDWHSCGAALAHRAIEIRQESVAKLQILAADRLDLRVVQVARIWNSGSVVIIYFDRTGIPGVPSPRKAEFPCAAMTAEERAKRSELEPAQIQLSGKFFCRHK